MSMHDKLEACLKDWSDLSDDYHELERKHKEYREVLEKCHSLQKKCQSGVTHQKYRLNVIKKLMKEIDPSCNEEKGELDDLEKDIFRRECQLSQMNENLPRKSGRYLQVIMGNVDVSILDKNEKYQYKEQYESFKLIVNLIGGILATTNFFLNIRALDILFMFLIVWYYCTLTIRESILIVNGSRIKVRFFTVSQAIHTVFFSREFRDQHMLFNVYVAFLQYLQYVYQKGCLYRLRSLGERKEMDITIDGFHSWMWKGLGFLIPFLYIGYMTQLYNSYTLYQLSHHQEACWQVPVLSALFFLLGAGNIITTSMTLPAKFSDSKEKLKYKFVRLDKYFWNHRKRRVTVSQANPKFSQSVDRILRRDKSESFHLNPINGIPESQEGEETASQTSDELDLEVQEVMDTIKDGILEDEDDNEVTPAHQEQPINQSTDKPHPDKKYD
ncbi:transmembrane protein 120 homolog [Eurytemora carolleeae]|uniref:transmembrane protein 120 homolog n=1 Tax=Eurytemora carolleeae TaxID=1294199 RepID=UPI000C78C17A|nr:transmembrane protein 120 homolog [Eurytemora carolleeae]|eukprot:XP_023337235.1 transmembrane protein 120 homolog [Eurytemora affinis]